MRPAPSPTVLSRSPVLSFWNVRLQARGGALVQYVRNASCMAVLVSSYVLDACRLDTSTYCICMHRYIKKNAPKVLKLVPWCHIATILELAKCIFRYPNLTFFSRSAVHPFFYNRKIVISTPVCDHASKEPSWHNAPYYLANGYT